MRETIHQRNEQVQLKTWKWKYWGEVIDDWRGFERETHVIAIMTAKRSVFDWSTLMKLRMNRSKLILRFILRQNWKIAADWSEFKARLRGIE